MKIERIQTIVTCPGRNFVTIKILTDEGVWGLGDATLNGRELAVKSYLEDHVVPCLIGRDPRNIGDIWQYLYQVRTGFHGATDLSPVCMAAAVNFGLWVPNFGIQELMPHTPLTNEVFPHNYRYEDGFLVMDEVPGLGVEINEELAAKYPYERAYLPVARLRDGSMWNW